MDGIAENINPESIEGDTTSHDRVLLNKIAMLDLPETCDPMTIIRLIEENDEPNTIDPNDIRSIHEKNDAAVIIQTLRETDFISVRSGNRQHGDMDVSTSFAKPNKNLTQKEEERIFRKIEEETENALRSIFETPAYFSIIRRYVEESIENRSKLKEYFDFNRMDENPDGEGEEGSEEIKKIKSIQDQLAGWLKKISDPKSYGKDGHMKAALSKAFSEFLTRDLPLRKKALDVILHSSSDLSKEILKIQKEALAISDTCMARKSFIDSFVRHESSGDWIEPLLKASKKTGKDRATLKKRLEAIRLSYEKIEDRIQMKVSAFRDKNKIISSSARTIGRQYEILCRYNMGLISHVIQMTSAISKGGDFQDLRGEGMISLIKAIEKFNYRRGNKFSTYATNWIRAGVKKAMDTHMSTIYTPAHVRLDLSRLRAAENLYSQKHHGEVATDAFLARELGVPEDKIHKLRRWETSVISLDTPVKGSEEETRTILHMVPDQNAESPEDSFRSRQIQEIVQKSMQVLSPLEEEVLCYQTGIHWGYRLTLQEIGKKFKMSPERIRLIIKEAREKLLKNAEKLNLAQELRNEFDIELSSII